MLNRQPSKGSCGKDSLRLKRTVKLLVAKIPQKKAETLLRILVEATHKRKDAWQSNSAAVNLV